MKNKIVLKRNEHLHYESDHVHCVYYLVSGSLKTYIHHPSRRNRLTLQLIDHECYFGYFELFTNEKLRLSSACVVSKDALIEKISADDFLNRLKHENMFCAKILTATIRNEYRLWNRIIIYKEYDSFRKIGWMLISIAKPSYSNSDILVIRGYSHLAISQYTGSTRPTISSALKYLKEAKVIEYDKNRIIISKYKMNKLIGS